MRFWSPRRRAFAEIWQTRISSGPAASLCAETLIDFLPYMLIIEMDATRQRYRNRLIGTEVVAHAGRDATGKWFEEIYSETQYGHHQAHQ